MSKLPRILLDYLAKNRLHCIDVGARGGMQDHWRPFAHLMQIDLFEPDSDACQKQAAMASANEAWFPVALGGQNGMAKLYVLKKPSGSSLYPPNPDIMMRFSAPGYGELNKVIEVPLQTASTFITKNQRVLPNLIKLDVQGAELDILRALETPHWADLLAIQTEVEFVELYKGQPLFDSLDSFLRHNGFVLFDILPVREYRFSGGKSHGLLRRHCNLAKNRNDISRRLIAADAFYVRSPEEVISTGDVTSILKLFLILVLYRFFDEALWLAEAAVSAGHITKEQGVELIGVVKAYAPKPTLLQRADRIGKWSRRIAKSLGLLRRKQDFWLDRSWDF